jgi:hypothetical protein
VDYPFRLIKIETCGAIYLLKKLASMALNIEKIFQDMTFSCCEVTAKILKDIFSFDVKLSWRWLKDIFLYTMAY